MLVLPDTAVSVFIVAGITICIYSQTTALYPLLIYCLFLQYAYIFSVPAYIFVYVYTK